MIVPSRGVGRDEEEGLAEHKWIPHALNTADFFTHIPPTLKETWARLAELGEAILA